MHPKNSALLDPELGDTTALILWLSEASTGVVARRLGAGSERGQRIQHVRWAEDGVAYTAVSDVAPAELDKFAELFRGHSAGSMTPRPASRAYAAKVAITWRRARASRDITVPIGTPVTAAISR